MVDLIGQQIKKGLQKHQVMELTFQLYPPAATGIKDSRKSTWMNPIVDGEEGNKMLGTSIDRHCVTRCCDVNVARVVVTS